jgi:predicted SnoaL-like aldol condensation-catalyzing enzyme
MGPNRRKESHQAMVPNPYDPRQRSDLSDYEKAVLHFTADCLHGDDASLVDRYIADGYIQHTHGVGQGKEGLRNFMKAVASRRPGRHIWRPIHLFSSGNFVILHKLLPRTVIVDMFRFNDEGKIAEHWDVVQPLPEPDYDPMRLSSEDFTRYKALYNLPD